MDKNHRNQEHSRFVKIPNSERNPLSGAKKVGHISPDEVMTVTLVVRRPPITSLLEKKKNNSFTENSHLSREAFAKSYGASTEDVKKVEAFAEHYNLKVKKVHEASGTMQLTGTAEAFSRAFNVELGHYEHPEFTYRGRTGHVQIPQELDGVVEAVLGLDNRPQSKAHFQVLQEDLERSINRSGNSYTPPQVSDLYNFPKNVDCSEQCIGIIELGGGYNPSELQQYFASLGVTQPKVKAVSVNGATNKPTGTANSADGEVVLDIEVAGAIAPGVNIAVYFAPNTDAGFLNAIKKAIHDTDNKPSVLSISWGQAESGWTGQSMTAMDRAFQDAAALGVTICCASGDRGSNDGVSDGLVHVDFPASSPHALACGGTKLEGTGNTITKEVVWNEGPGSSTGGGVSDTFDLPDYQKAVNIPESANPGNRKGRGVPDVAGDADPVTGYQILVDGQQIVVGGTSAVAPLWAGLIALINQQVGHPVGFINPVIYESSFRNSAFHDITEGNNDSSQEPNAYVAQPGWDACTGLGSPNGVKLSNAFQGAKQTS